MKTGDGGLIQIVTEDTSHCVLLNRTYLYFAWHCYGLQSMGHTSAIYPVSGILNVIMAVLTLENHSASSKPGRVGETGSGPDEQQH